MVTARIPASIAPRPRPTRRALGGLALGALAAGLPGRAMAAWPDHPVTAIVPYPPGGNNDILARLLSPAVERALGQTLIIENRGGGGGTIGATAAARAEPDGYTLAFLDIGTLAIAPFLFARLSYQPESFEPLIRLTEVPLTVGVPAGSPYRTLQDLLAAAKAKPNGITYASPGNGTAGHLAAQMLVSLSGARMVHVPYRGSGPAVTELTAGRVDLLIDGTLLPAVQQGQLRALATTGPHRSPFLPDVPTVAEAALPAYSFLSWHGVAAPKGTPAPVLARLNAAFDAALRDPMVVERAKQLGLPLKGGTAAEFAAFASEERKKMEKLVQESGARVE
ncbi:tripartite tricarboxylate transporter substrate binding protein [Roseomonas sp. M0104]|uniref:Tripartite tricarboxylate transporter substrate binding protein n=1 Tax=Teichococcus coralli TaxID=2545983 RepID=A0A845B9R1_9PROT|nr:tripartite tricarboxylate transporter substrate binding protein [Pseudoroseomonas coralli]MXP62122.1 tripartite tricarboxylate transporter substrate binding protein [Pseudoroseomonas coralli]